MSLTGNYVVQIPKQLNMYTAEGLFYPRFGNNGFRPIIFDFSAVNFITPEAMIILVISSQHLNKLTGQTIHWRVPKRDIRAYLERMNINKLPFVHLEIPFQLVSRVRQHSDSLIELSHISTPLEIGRAIKETRDILSLWFPNNANHVQQNLSTLIKETVENSIDHSGTSPDSGNCYYALQKYSHSDGTTEIQIAVGDNGIGILNSQKTRFPETKDDADAIYEALINGRTCRSNGNGGMGFMNVRSALSPLNGVLTIRSGRGCIIYNSSALHPKIYRQLPDLPGTQVLFMCRA